MSVTNHGGASNNIMRPLIISGEKQVWLQVESPQKCKEDLQNRENGTRTGWRTRGNRGITNLTVDRHALLHENAGGAQPRGQRDRAEHVTVLLTVDQILKC
jgi:hypothetical protein